MQHDAPTSHDGYYGEGYGRFTYLPPYGYYPYPPPYKGFLPTHPASSRRKHGPFSNSPSRSRSHSSGSGQDEPERCIDTALVGAANVVVLAPTALADIATVYGTTAVTCHEHATTAGNTSKEAHNEEDDVPLSQLFRTGLTKECPAEQVSLHFSLLVFVPSIARFALYIPKFFFDPASN